MLNTPRSRWIAVGSLAVLLVAAGAAVAGDGGRDRAGRGAGRHRRHRVARTMDRLDALSDGQAKAALDASGDLAKIRDEARAKAAAIVLQAHRDAKASPDQRQKIREATREKLKALRAEYAAPFTEAGMKIVRTLTPEQRAKIGEKAKARGRTVTDEHLAKFFGKRLSRPWAEALLRARVEGGATAPAGGK